MLRLSSTVMPEHRGSTLGASELYCSSLADFKGAVSLRFRISVKHSPRVGAHAQTGSVGLVSAKLLNWSNQMSISGKKMKYNLLKFLAWISVHASVLKCKLLAWFCFSWINPDRTSKYLPGTHSLISRANVKLWWCLAEPLQQHRS